MEIIKDITQEEAMKESFVNKHFEYINTEKNLQTQRETFVASIGHDLKNPTLAQIRSLELLLNGVFGKFQFFNPFFVLFGSPFYSFFFHFIPPILTRQKAFKIYQ